MHFKQKSQHQKNIVFLAEKNSLWMQTFYFYHTIYYKLKKINNFFFDKISFDFQSHWINFC